MASDDKSVNMQKWGIPEDDMVSPEVTLLERLVWVPYKTHWWPALIYQDYTELQDHMYNDLDVVSKAQFATAIMRQLNYPKPIKIARLLGREVLEVVEVEESEFAEFYWQLPKVLPMACRKSKYGSDTKLYLDFHRALDQVEEIIKDISSRSFNLVPDAGKKTWLERAQEALAVPSVTSSIAKDDASRSSNSIQLSRNLKQKEADDQEEYHFLFAALDGVMEKCNNTYDCVTGNVEDNIVEDTIQNKPHMLAISKQRETRDSLRKVLERQRQIREGGSVACIADDNEREGNEDLVKNPSTEALTGVSGEDPALWKLLNSNDPEMSVATSKKTFVQPFQGRPSPTANALIDSREEYPEDDKEALLAEARARASVELENSFFDYLTCNTRTPEY